MVADLVCSFFGSSFSIAMTLPTNKTYLDLIFEAILTLHQGGATTAGPSLHAIKKHIENQYPDLEMKSVSPTLNPSSLLKFLQHYLRAALKKGIEEKRIVQMRGSFRISAAELRAVVRRPTIMTSVAVAQNGSAKKIKKDKKVEAPKAVKKNGKPQPQKKTKIPTPKKAK
jgi:hypothetical protein